MSSYDVLSWLQAVVRWIHVFAAILWIGQTYLFNFFERHLLRGSGEETKIGDLWMVHGGGFYKVEKYRFEGAAPTPLHWFKWEAAGTWLSGVALITLTYYYGGLLVEPDMSYARAALAGIGVVVVGWIIYDLLVRSPLGRHEVLLAIVGLLLVLATHHGLEQVMSRRAALIHIGALLGTIMTANVWVRILPAQRKMLAAAGVGEPIASALGAVGPARSKHNSYMVVPLIFVMISNHYPTISYSHAHSTLMLGAVLLVGGLVARFMRG